jgi:multidrug efflux pump subunit AcrB
MLALAIFGFRFVTKSFFPPSTRPQFMVHYWLPQGTSITRTESDAAKLEKYLLGLEGVENVSSFVGGGALRFLLTYSPEEPNSAYALLIVTVDDYRKGPGVIAKLDQFARENLPDAQMFSRRFILGPGDPSKIQVRFRGPDPEVLRKLAEETKQVLHAEPQVVDILDDWRQRVPVLRPLINEVAARNNGLTRAQIAAAMQQAFEGQPVGVFREKDLLLPIIARSPQAERNDVGNLQDIRVWSPAAQRSIPVGLVVSGSAMVSDNDIIRRRDRLPTITVKCDPAQGEAAPVFELIRPRVEQRFGELKQAMRLKEYSLEWGGEYENSRDSQNGLNAKMPPILIAMILLVVVLFNSIRQPLAIFLVVPTAMIGLTVGLLAAGQPFGFMALLGFLSLSGMLIKNAIVLIDEINSNLALGSPPYPAVVEAGLSRVRPVVNAAATTVLGMTPLLLDPFYSAMAVAVMAGLTFGTVLTLIVVPVLYTILFRIPSPASTSIINTSSRPRT